MPSIDHLLDHTGTVWRPQDAFGALRTNARTYTRVATGVPVAVRRPSARYQNIGAGVTGSGDRVLYTSASVDLRARDVVVLATGPDAGTRWEIDEDTTRPRGHHAELRCRAFHGVLS